MMNRPKISPERSAELARRFNDAADAVGEVEQFYKRSAWPIGTQVRHAENPALVGDLVRRVARLWVDRNSKPPMVRWRGKLDAVEVPWDRLDTR